MFTHSEEHHQPESNSFEWSSPEAGLDLAAAVDVALVLHGQRQVPQVVQANAGII